MASTDIDRLSIDTIRTLSMDGVQAANSGTRGCRWRWRPWPTCSSRGSWRHDPADPQWPDRDRFVLSRRPRLDAPVLGRCTSRGYDLPLDELKSFRQWGSLTPGHPERDRVHVTPGVEITTGPLGQGFANGVGMAMAERFLRAHFGAEVQDHRVFAIVSDGDLMEGIAAEAASLAGKLGLGRIVYLYDDNDDLARRPDGAELRLRGRRQALRGLRLARADRRRRQRPRRARGGDRRRPCARRSARRSSASSRSSAGPSPNKQGTSKAHGSPLGEDEVRLTKEILGWDPDEHFVVPDEVREHFDQRARGAALQAEWEQRFAAWRDGARRARRRSGTPPGRAGRCPALREALQNIDWGKDKLATRSAGQQAMAAFARQRADDGRRRRRPQRVDEDRVPRRPRAQLQHGRPARNVFFGVREHGMGGVGQRHGRPRRHRAARTARPSCSSPTTCAARSACRR